MNRHLASDESPLPRIEAVEPLGGRTVKVTWRGGFEQSIDVTAALMSRRIFLRLRTDDDLFRAMKVNEDGNAIEWPDGAELTAVWLERLAPSALDNDAFRDAMDELGLSLDGMAARLGVSRRLIADYRKDKPIPELVGLAIERLMEKQRLG